MFGHIFTYRLKSLMRERSLLFWTLMFPLVLAIFFNLAFSNLSSGDAFKSIPIAVVNDDAYKNEAAFQSALKTVSDSGSADKLFNVTLESEGSAARDLNDSKIDGYIILDGGARVVVKSSDMNQTILKEFMDTYLQTASAYKTIIRENPAAAASLMSADSTDFIRNVPPAKSSADNTVAIFYALIAMTAMFGGYWGKKEIEDIQADLSPLGARVNLSPVHKMKAFTASFCASVTVQFFCLAVLIAFLKFVLKINFGDQVGYILIICFAGSVVGVAFGALIAAVVKGSAHLKTSVMLAASMLLSCLAGLMSVNLKYTVTHTVPFMAYINPANLVSDALYSLYYYSSHTRFYMNIGLLFALSAVFMAIVCSVLRRRKYASL